MALSSNIVITISLAVFVFVNICVYGIWIYIAWKREGLMLDATLGSASTLEFASSYTTTVSTYTTTGSNANLGSAATEGSRRAYPRGTEIGVMAYVNRVLRVLFTVFGLLTIFLSVILDNYFNDKPLRFIGFGILTPFTICLGVLSSGWFPKIPLRCIAFIKRRLGVLEHVVPCSPWHDNVLTDFCGDICTLEGPADQADAGSSQIPQVLHDFLYGDCTQGAVVTVTTDSQDEGQLASSSFQKAPTKGETVLVQIDRPSVNFRALENGCRLAFIGPTIKGIPLEFQVFRNLLSSDDFKAKFDLSCTFRNKRIKMYLDTQELQNLAQNMTKWVENPYPIIVEESTGILHCMAIQDILWKFTKGAYTLTAADVSHRFLAGVKVFSIVITTTFLTLSTLLSLVPLVTEKKSMFFLFLLIPALTYTLILEFQDLICYSFKSFICPIFIYFNGYSKLYKKRSSYIWCNEFRKQKVVNPSYFLIDQEYAHTIPGIGDNCFSLCKAVEVPGTATSLLDTDVKCIIMTCHGRQSAALPTADLAADQPADPTIQLVANLSTLQQIVPVASTAASTTNQPPPGADPIFVPPPEPLTSSVDLIPPSANPTNSAGCDNIRSGIRSNCSCHGFVLKMAFTSAGSGSCNDVKLSFWEDNTLLDSLNCFGSYDIRRVLLIEKLFSYFSDPGFGGFIDTIAPGFRSQSYIAQSPRFLDACAKILDAVTLPTLLLASRKPGCNVAIGVPFKFSPQT